MAQENQPDRKDKEAREATKAPQSGNERGTDWEALARKIAARCRKVLAKLAD